MVLARRTIHAIEKEGSLYFLINAFIGAYNRRTDVMERGLNLDERIRAAAQKLSVSGESLKQTVKDNQPEGESK